MTREEAIAVSANDNMTVRWYRQARRQSRSVTFALSIAALSAAAVWALWRYAGTATQSGYPHSGPTVRIGVVADSTHLRVIMYGAFDIISSAGRAVFTCAGPNVLRFSASVGQPATSYYYVIVEEYGRSQKSLAYRRLAQWCEALKVGMEILEGSSNLVAPKSRAALADRLLVAIGPFDDVRLAEQWEQSLLQRKSGVYMVKDTSKRAASEIHLFDPTDRLLARMKDSVSIRLKDERQVFAVEAIKSDPGWAKQKRTTPCYRGTLELHLNEQGRLTACNCLPLEDYVNGVVPSEIGGWAPSEALKAQAIAARSEAMHKLDGEHHSGDLYDFCGKVHCQLYRGIEDQSAASLTAAAETRGLVLSYDGRIVDTVYHHSCGGVSAGGPEVWRSANHPFFRVAFDDRSLWRFSANLSAERQTEAWLAARPDVFCNSDQRQFPEYARKYFRWTRRIEGSSLERSVNDRHNVGQILDLQVVRRGQSGRVGALRIVGSKSSILYTGVDNVCAVLNDLPSSFFTLHIEHETQSPRRVKSVTVNGGGFGHGVGMCQMGAYMMAMRRYSCETILAHYYQGTRIARAY
ncbi:SpoIID/LytB domain-containing protein [Candidatus Sumerlaeota bacterium]|nr:SpoIID/LytB domain-containing protein [Candidatus Sumerlaeota bacterium]